MCTMSHLCELNPGVAGTARDGVNYVNVPPSWEGSPNGITERAKAEIAAMRPEVCKLVPNEVEEGQPEGSAGFKLMFLEFDRDTIRANLQVIMSPDLTTVFPTTHACVVVQEPLYERGCAQHTIAHGHNVWCLFDPVSTSDAIVEFDFRPTLTSITGDWLRSRLTQRARTWISCDPLRGSIK